MIDKLIIALNYRLWTPKFKQLNQLFNFSLIS